MKRTRGRPARSEPLVRIVLSLRLRVGEDDDLIAFFQAIPSRQRSQRIKQTLRSGAGAVTDTPSAESIPDHEMDEALDSFLF